MKTEIIKGFKDFTGKEAEKREVIKQVVKGVFEKYGFESAETPIIESEDFVKGENQDDEAVSDIYKLKDKRKRKLALRYEFTFQLRRLMKNKKLPYKRFQIGEVFRDEPTGVNRLRQFTTCEADVVGAALRDQAEMFALINEILDKLKIQNIIYFNNRKLLNEILEEFKIKNKLQVIRELDKLDKLPESEVRKNLKKFGAEKILEIVKQKETYFEKYKSYEEIKKLKEYAKNWGIRVVFLPCLARGLSYYNGTVFEIKTKKIKETICGGGEFEFDGKNCFGLGVSIDRLSAVTNLIVDLEKWLIVSLEQDKEAVKVAQRLRNSGKIVSIYYGKPSKALEYANSYKINKAIFVGNKEVKNKEFKVKDMGTGRESLMK